MRTSKMQKDRFEHDLNQLINQKKIEQVIQKIDEFKYPPMDFYEKFINRDLFHDDLQARMKKNPNNLETNRVSPMLRGYIDNDGFLKKQ